MVTIWKIFVELLAEISPYVEMTILCGYNVENLFGATCEDLLRQFAIARVSLRRNHKTVRIDKNQPSLNQYFSNKFIYLVTPKTNLLSKTTINERTY